MCELMKFIIAFYGMEKPAQDAYVWSSEAVPRCQPHNIDLYMIKKKVFVGYLAISTIFVHKLSWDLRPDEEHCVGQQVLATMWETGF
jgi:hypothetical protein